MFQQIINKIGRRLLGNSLWLLIDKVVRLVIGLFIGVMVARYLGPERMGVWNYCLAIFTFFIILPSLGLEYICPREFVNRKGEAQKLLNTAIVLKFVGATIGIIVSTVFMGIIKGFDSFLVSFIFILTAGYLFQSVDVIDYYYQSRLEQKKSVLAKLLAFILVSLYKFCLIKYEAPLIWFVASSTLDFFLASIALLYSLRKSRISISTRYFDKEMAKSLLRDSLAIAVSALVIVIYYKIDQIMITEMIGEKENGIYSVSIRIYELFTFIPTVLISSFLPVITQKYKEDEAAFRASLKQLYSLLTYLAGIFTIGVWLFGPFVMDLLYQEEYAGSGRILQVISLGFYFVFLGMGTGNYLIIRNKKRFIFIRSIVGLLLNVVLNLWLIPIYGAIGAAVTSILSSFVSTFLIFSLKDNHNHLGLLLAPFNIASIKRFIKYE